MKYTLESALGRVKRSGAKVNTKKGLIELPKDGVGLKVLGACDYLEVEHNYGVVRRKTNDR